MKLHRRRFIATPVAGVTGPRQVAGSDRCDVLLVQKSGSSTAFETYR